MSKYIKVRELENLKCHLDEKAQYNKDLGDKDIYYRGKLAAYEDISAILDKIMDDAVDIIGELKRVHEIMCDDYSEIEDARKEEKGINPYLGGRQTELNRLINYLSGMIAEYE